VTTGFDRKRYWEDRLREEYSLEGTGFKSLGEGFNKWIYRVQRRNFLSVVRPLVSAQPTAKVLDVGSGTGFYVDRWHELGIRELTGSDITSKAVSELSHRSPTDRFVQLDIGGEDLSALAGERFDFVSACAVLYHVVDDAAYERAFHNIHSLLEDDGLFIFSENFPRNEAYRTEIQTVRLEGEILALLDRVGFEVVTRAPIYAVMNNPVSSDSRLLRAWWRKLTRVLRARKAAGPALGAALYPLELALVSLLKRGPSTELVVCRKTGD
jgi:2-polyprenyl-3-methyl-5-hydroxy-6-metoxy-1,4-benzoquinol methylase